MNADVRVDNPGLVEGTTCLRIWAAIILVCLATASSQSDSSRFNVVERTPGQVAILECAIPGIKPSFVKWRKDGKDLSKTGLRFNFDWKTANLFIYIETTEQEGNYTCYAAYGPHFEPYTVELIVLLFPRVLVTSPNPVEPMEGMNVTLVCTAHARPLPYFQWYSSREVQIAHKGQLLAEQDRIQLVETVLGPDNLTLESRLVVEVKALDRGLYKCIANSRVGSAREEIRLDVQFVPRLLAPSNPTTQVEWWEGHATLLTCKAVANPAPVIAWTSASSSSPPHKGRDFNLQPMVSVFRGNEVTSTVSLPTTATFDLPAAFECRAENVYGETPFRQFYVSQIYAPPPPVVEAVRVKLNEITLSFSVPWQEATPIPTYVSVDYVLGRGSTSRHVEGGTMFRGNGTTMTLYGIVLEQTFVINITVMNRVGYSNEMSLEIVTEDHSSTPKAETVNPPVSSKGPGRTSTNLDTVNGFDDAKMASSQHKGGGGGGQGGSVNVSSVVYVDSSRRSVLSSVCLLAPLLVCAGFVVGLGT